MVRPTRGLNRSPVALVATILLGLPVGCSSSDGAGASGAEPEGGAIRPAGHGDGPLGPTDSGASAPVLRDGAISDARDGGAPLGPLSIEFNYDFDSKGMFAYHARRRLLEAAARAWTARIAEDFEDIPAGTAIRARHPERPGEEGMVFELDEPIDDLMLLVGFSVQDGPSGQLGFSSHSFTYKVEDDDLQQRLETRFNGLPFEPWVGSISFDVETQWFFDITPQTADDIPEDKSDFMATAMHELGHILGIGALDHWSTLVENGHFVGPSAMKIHGGPVPLDPDGVHVDQSVRSEGREVLMDTQTTVGTRVYPTPLDFAILEDLGYAIRDSTN